MNLTSRPHYTNEEKHNFYAAAAKRFKAELKLYGATAAIHLENKNDEVFWGKVLQYAYPSGKFRFIAASRSLSGNMTTGCTQCLQYKDFLDSKFWIAIDSDYRYLSQEPEIDAHHNILQTYTYSFENHFCFGTNANAALALSLGITSSGVADGESLPFDFCRFLTEYSRIVYPLLVWQLYLQGISPEAFPQSVFHRLLNVTLGANATRHNGAAVLQILKERAHKLRTHLKNQYPDADPTWYEARCNDLGVHRDNCYLFVRGHNLYDLVVDLGHRVRQEVLRENPELRGSISFENALTSQLKYGEYDEIRHLVEDVHKALGLI